MNSMIRARPHSGYLYLPLKLYGAKTSSPDRLSSPIPTDLELALDDHRLYFPGGAISRPRS
ncbi:hypothetical protein PIB30_065931 [Stylosanthes scabra]|uniref:Uncharacterized protein n=1 Tax=Stylosanthes scabra TaxID=79078 RepID=A0ABU6WKG3_9FABA|nr:hypothetical protein [Stylosanthes scabra]